MRKTIVLLCILATSTVYSAETPPCMAISRHPNQNAPGNLVQTHINLEIWDKGNGTCEDSRTALCPLSITLNRDTYTPVSVTLYGDCGGQHVE